MKRAENGFGTIVCLDKTGKKRRKPFAVRITVGWVDGKQKTKYLGYYATRKEATLALAEHHIKGTSADASTITWEELFDMWKDRNSNMKESNMNGYLAAFKLTPQLHSKKVKDIKSKTLQDAMDSVNRKHSSKSKIKSLWNQMYELAVLDDLAVKNYSTGVDLKCSQEETGNPYSREEIKTLWKMTEKDDLFEDILLLIYTGTRITEALNLTPSDVHLEDGYIECRGTKTKAADRLIPIHPDIKPLLEKRMDRLYLFLSKTGTKAQYRAFQYRYANWMEKLGWNHIVHDTRKTFVTILHENNIMLEDIASIVGHSQKGVTAKVYLKTNIEHLINKMNKVKFI